VIHFVPICSAIAGADLFCCGRQLVDMPGAGLLVMVMISGQNFGIPMNIEARKARWLAGILAPKSKWHLFSCISSQLL